MRSLPLPNVKTPLILSLSKDTRQDQPLCVGFDKLSSSGCENMVEWTFVSGGVL